MAYDCVTLLLALASAYAIGNAVYVLYFCPLRDIPGPLLARFTCLWEILAVLQSRSHEDYIQLHRVYGSVVRVGRNRVSFNGSDALQLYKDRLPKSDYYEAFGDPSKPNMLSMRDDNAHVQRKSKFNRVYSTEAMPEYDSAIQEQTGILVSKLSTFAADEVPVSMTDLLKLYSFGIITKLTLGKDFHGLRTGTDGTGILAAISAAVRYSAVLGLLPKLHRLVVTVTGAVGIEAPIIRLLNTAERAAREYDSLRNDASKPTPKAPFLERLFRIYDDDRVDFRAVHDCCSSNIAAGSDTTAITISAALWYLHRERETLERLRAEIDKAVDDARALSFADLRRLPYLDAVVRETLRLHPAVGSMLPRQVRAGGMYLADRFFPEGTVVGVNAWALHYNEAVYGPDATEFRPERWIEPGCSIPDPFSFGAGTRRCIGEQLGLAIIRKGVAEFVRNFHLEPTGPEKDWVVNGAWFVWPNYRCHVRAREQWFSATADVTESDVGTVVGDDVAF